MAPGPWPSVSGRCRAQRMRHGWARRVLSRWRWASAVIVSPFNPRLRIVSLKTLPPQASPRPVPSPPADAARSLPRVLQPPPTPPRPRPADSSGHLNARIRARPSQPDAPTHYRVRRDRLDAKGNVTLRYLSKLRHIPVGAAHRNRKVILLVAGPDVRIVTDGGTLLRHLTLDPDRSYQPLGGRWPSQSVNNVPRQASTMS